MKTQPLFRQIWWAFCLHLGLVVSGCRHQHLWCDCDCSASLLVPSILKWRIDLWVFFFFFREDYRKDKEVSSYVGITGSNTCGMSYRPHSCVLSCVSLPSSLGEAEQCLRWRYWGLSGGLAQVHTVSPAMARGPQLIPGCLHCPASRF